MSEKTFLGDSVYAHCEYHTGDIVLTTINGYDDDPRNTIVLDRDVLAALDRFRAANPEQAETSTEDIDERLSDSFMNYEAAARVIRVNIIRNAAIYKQVLDAFEELKPVSCYADSSDLNISIAGSKTDLGNAWAVLRKLGFSAPSNRPEANQSEFRGTFINNDDVRVYLVFSSTVCRRVPTGKKIEVDEYEIRCD